MSAALPLGQSPRLCALGTAQNCGWALAWTPAWWDEGRGTQGGAEREVDQVGAPGFRPLLCWLLKATAQVLLMLLLKVSAHTVVSCSTGLVVLVVPFG